MRESFVLLNESFASQMIASKKLWWGTLVVIILDGVLVTEIASFIRSSGVGGHCGTWAVHLHTRMIVLAVLCLHVGGSTSFFYWKVQKELSPFARWSTRLPLCCMAALLLTYFVAFPVVSYVF